MQIERHGLNRNPEIGPIAKASFEEVMTILTQAAVFGEKENMKGVSANILAGQFCKSGTNCFEILMDEEKLLEEMEDSSLITSNLEEATPEKVDKLFDQIYDKKEKYQDINENAFEFGFGMENNEEYMLSKNNDSHIKITKGSKGTNGSKEKAIINVNSIDEITLDEINIENDAVNSLTLDEVDDIADDVVKVEEKNKINNLILDEVVNQDNVTLNVETTVEEKPKKRGRPKKSA